MGIGLVTTGVLLVGCSSTSVGSTESALAGSLASSTPKASAGPSAVQTPMPSGIDRCTGVEDVESASILILDDNFDALVDVDIESTQLNVEDGVEVQRVASSKVVAGALSNGELATIEIGVKGAGQALPNGHYLIIAGRTAFKGRYLMGDGLYGTFIVSGNEVSQQCPNSDKPSVPRLAEDGTHDMGTLINYFDEAFARRK